MLSLYGSRGSMSGLTIALTAFLGFTLQPTLLQAEGKKGAAQASAASDQASPQGDSPSVYDQVVPSVCVIEPEINGEYPTRGTGWVLDREQRLILTNDHVTKGATDCVIYFPLLEDGQVVTEEDRNIEAARAIAGKVVDSDAGLDLSIVQLEELPDNAAALTLATKSASPGQRVHSIAGNSKGSQSFWTYSTGHVRQLVQGTLANNGKAKLLESDMATNSGNSGGPVFNDAGQVVAVVEGHRTDGRMVSIYVDRESVKSYLDAALPCIAPKTMEQRLTAIRRHLDAERFDTALDLASQAVKHDPTAAAYTIRGECFAMSGDVDTAAGDFEQAINIDSKYADAHYWLGILARWRGDFDASYAALTQAIRSEPQAGIYRYERGMTRFEEASFQDAWKDFNEAVRFEDTATNAIVYRSACEMELGRLEEAAKQLVKLVQDDIVHVQGLYYLGQISERIQDPASAETYYTAAIRADQEHEDSQALLALVALLAGAERTNDAIQWMEELLPSYAQDPQVWAQRGQLLRQVNPQEALASIEKAKELDPDHADSYDLADNEPTADATTEASDEQESAETEQ